MTEISPSPDRSVVLPVYDVAPETVLSLVNELVASAWDEVIIAVDMPDASMREHLDSLRDDSRMKISLHERRRGKGRALRDGLALTSGSIIGYVDADGAISIEELNRLYKTVEASDADVAVGSRDLDGSTRQGQSLLRRVLGRGYQSLARQTIQTPVCDVQCGAKAFSQEAWMSIADSIDERGFAFDTELVARFARRGYDIEEVTIDWRDPGESSVAPGRDALAMLISLFRIRRRLAIESQADGRGVKGNECAVGRDGRLKVALVTSHPPNHGHLAEYGEALAKRYGLLADLELTVLSRRTRNAPHIEQYGAYEVRRIWERDSTLGALRLMNELRRGDYDVVQFNIHMTYFGQKNINRFIGLLLPPFVRRLCGVPVITTLHDLLEVVEEDVVEETVGSFERIGARMATQLLLFTDATTVTAEDYREVITDRYWCNSVYHVPHGTFEQTDGGVQPVAPPLRILVFGHLGPMKDIETVIEAFGHIRKSIPDAELLIAGGSHPGHPKYREQLETEHGDVPGVRFTGYVEEGELADVWSEASLVIMPYRTCTGVSGVYQLAKSYGTPVVAFDVDSMRTSTVETGGVAMFVPPGDPTALATAVVDLWDDPTRLHEMALANINAAAEHTIADTADQLVDIMKGVAR